MAKPWPCPDEVIGLHPHVGEFDLGEAAWRRFRHHGCLISAPDAFSTTVVSISAIASRTAGGSKIIVSRSTLKRHALVERLERHVFTE